MSSLNDVLATPAHPLQPYNANWARDFAFVGGVSSFLALFLVAGTALGWATLLGTTAAGALTGAALGAFLKRPLRGPLGATSWPLLGLLFLAVGACWGALVGALGTVVLMAQQGVDPWSPRHSGATGVLVFFMGCAAVAAAAQLAWFAVVYARADRAGTPTWPLLLAACGTPFLGMAALQVVSLGLWFGSGSFLER